MAHGDMGKGYHPVWRGRERSWGGQDRWVQGPAELRQRCGCSSPTKLPHTGAFIWFSFFKRCLFPQKLSTKSMRNLLTTSLQRATLQTKRVYEKGPFSSRGDGGKRREEGERLQPVGANAGRAQGPNTFSKRRQDRTARSCLSHGDAWCPCPWALPPHCPSRLPQ